MQSTKNDIDMKRRLTAIVERGRGKGNFSCFATESIGKYGLAGYGTSARKAMEDIMESVRESREMAAEEGEDFPEVEFDFRFDIGAFFDYYPIDLTAFAKYIGMNASVVRQYATALREPKQAQIDRIREGIAKFAQDLGLGLMIDCPVLEYTKK